MWRITFDAGKSIEPPRWRVGWSHNTLGVDLGGRYVTVWFHRSPPREWRNRNWREKGQVDPKTFRPRD